MGLDFEQTRDLAKQKIREKDALEGEKPLTERQKSDIEFYVKQMEKHILEYANRGKQTFLYDCSKLEKHVFYALARAFKDENPSFFVMTRGGCQELTVDWSDKHEV
jgi:hypothetical protein